MPAKVAPWVPDSDGSERVEPPSGGGVKRINVAVSRDTASAIQLLMDREDIGLTEAVRRLLTYGEFVYQTIKDGEKELMVREGDKLSGVVLLR